MTRLNTTIFSLSLSHVYSHSPIFQQAGLSSFGHSTFLKNSFSHSFSTLYASFTPQASSIFKESNFKHFLDTAVVIQGECTTDYTAKISTSSFRDSSGICYHLFQRCRFENCSRSIGTGNFDDQTSGGLHYVLNSPLTIDQTGFFRCTSVYGYCGAFHARTDKSFVINRTCAFNCQALKAGQAYYAKTGTALNNLVNVYQSCCNMEGQHNSAVVHSSMIILSNSNLTKNKLLTNGAGAAIELGSITDAGSSIRWNEFSACNAKSIVVIVNNMGLSYLKLNFINNTCTLGVLYTLCPNGAEIKECAFLGNSGTLIETPVGQTTVDSCVFDKTYVAAANILLNDPVYPEKATRLPVPKLHTEYCEMHDHETLYPTATFSPSAMFTATVQAREARAMKGFGLKRLWRRK